MPCAKEIFLHAIGSPALIYVPDPFFIVLYSSKVAVVVSCHYSRRVCLFCQYGKYVWYGIWNLTLWGDMFAEITEYEYGTSVDTKTMAMKKNFKICTISFPFHIWGMLFMWKDRNLIRISEYKWFSLEMIPVMKLMYVSYYDTKLQCRYWTNGTNSFSSPDFSFWMKL